MCKNYNCIKALPSPNGDVSSFVNPKGNYLDPDREYTYSFLGGSADDHRNFKEGLQRILDVVPGLKIREVSEAGNIRISFDQNAGSYSYVGRQILRRTNPNTETMNIGFRGRDNSVVVHELCHTLNFLHVQARLDLDHEKTYEFFERVAGWSRETTFHNLLSFDERSNDISGQPDLDSIMLYFLPREIFIDPNDLGAERDNSVLSTGDIDRLNELFPPPREPVQPEEPTVVPVDPDTEITDTSNFLQLYGDLFETFSDISRLKESQVVVIAKSLGIEASEKDLKRDTIIKVVDRILGL